MSFNSDRYSVKIKYSMVIHYRIFTDLRSFELNRQAHVYLKKFLFCGKPTIYLMCRKWFELQKSAYDIVLLTLFF